MKITFAVRKENIEKSLIQIMIPRLLSEGAERDPGNPGLGGYSLRLRRILQLVDDAPKDQAIGK